MCRGAGLGAVFEVAERPRHGLLIGPEPGERPFQRSAPHQQQGAADLLHHAEVPAGVCEAANADNEDLCPYEQQSSNAAAFNQWYRGDPAVNRVE